MKRYLSTPFTFDKTVRLVLGVAVFLLILWAICAIWDSLLPFFLSGLLAYVLMPLVRFFQNTLRLRSRALSASLVFAMVISLLTIGVLYLLPAIQNEIDKTLSLVSDYSGGQNLIDLLVPEQWRKYIEGNLNLSQFASDLTPTKIIEVGKEVFSQLGKVIDGTLSVFSWGLVIFMSILYFIMILMDFEGLVRGFVGVFPVTYRGTVRSILKEVDYYMNSYFRGQGLVALSVGILLSIGFSIIGLPMAIAMGITIGLLNLVPYMQAIGLIPLTFMAILMSAQTGQSVYICLLLAYGVLVIVQVIQDGFLVPQIMGHSLGIRPALLLLSLSIWGSLLGFFGMLIALPLSMSLYSLYMRYILEDQDYIAKVDGKIRQRNSRGKIKEKQPLKTK